MRKKSFPHSFKITALRLELRDNSPGHSAVDITPSSTSHLTNQGFFI